MAAVFVEDTSAIAQHLSARVELAITKVLGAETDELDGPSFDAIAFINKKFPDEHSLDGLERAIAEFDSGDVRAPSTRSLPAWTRSLRPLRPRRKRPCPLPGRALPGRACARLRMRARLQPRRWRRRLGSSRCCSRAAP